MDTVTRSAQAPFELGPVVPRIWNFFDQFAVAGDHWLPPDNVRIEPGHAVAHRTSPTNIGYLLLSVVAAFEFQLISADDLLTRAENVLTTLEHMERYRGHLYNWYDTQTLELLHP